ncbi:MAG: flagellar motor switch protein FliN/FliY [Gammaproteobacteria bacterium]|jgi:flagellar motor switch protein FliN/FliY
MSEEIMNSVVEDEAMQAQVQEEVISDADALMAESMGVQPAPLNDLRDEAIAHPKEDNLDAILDIPISLSVEIGQTKISIRNLLQLNQGSVVELDRLAGEPLDVMVNNTLVAHGEIVVINEKYGIRLTDVISALERVKNLQ